MERTLHATQWFSLKSPFRCGMSADLERLLKLTKRPGYMSVCHRDEKGIFKTSVVRTDKAAAAASQAADSGGGSDVWISFGRIAGPARKNKGRGTAKDVQALTALQVDVDVKVGGMPSMEAAWAVVHDLSTILGVEPAAVTSCPGTACSPGSSWTAQTPTGHAMEPMIRAGRRSSWRPGAGDGCSRT